MKRVFALALAAAMAVLALADRETAQFSAGRADKALAAKQWDDADHLYRKAIEEDESYLPARFGLAQSMIGAGKSSAALDELRKFADDARAAGAALPAEWKPLLAKAEKQLVELDAAGAALAKMQKTYADALVEFAQRWASKDPATAERALRRSLKLKVGNPKAIQLLEKLGLSTASEVVQLFDGASLGDWTYADPPMWTVDDGQIVGLVKSGAYICWSQRSFEGDFVVRCEARVLEQYAQPVFFAIQPCRTAQHHHYELGVLRGKIDWSDDTGSEKDRSIASKSPADLKNPFDPMEWNTYELRCIGGTTVAVVNGEEIGREERPEWRRGGSVGLKIQNVKVAFRKIEVEVR